MSERIAGYYDAADRPMADYLAARGWTGEPETHDPGSRHLGAGSPGSPVSNLGA